MWTGRRIQEIYRPVSPISIPVKVMEQIILSAITQHMQGNQVIRCSQYGFMKSRSCLISRNSFYDKTMHSEDKGKAVKVIYLDSSKVLDTVFHCILLEKLAQTGVQFAE